MAYPQVENRTRPVSRAWAFIYPGALAGVTLLALILRVVGIGRYPGLIYDEYYYVPAADVLLRRRPPVVVKSMVPGIDPNLLSHPPLAKELIALAIWLFGSHPSVWRLPGVVFGSLVPLVVAGIAFELFRKQGVALLAAGLASVDGLLVTMSRVALPDSSAVPLTLAALWMLLRVTRRVRHGEAVSHWSWMGLGGILGLALAAEWIGAQAICLSWVWCMGSGAAVRKQYRRWVPATTVVPFVVYYLTYFYAWGTGFRESWLPKSPFVAFFTLQWLMLKDMWSLRFFHPWTSNVWTWLGIPRPTALILSVTSQHTVRLMAFSDPILVWMGLISIVGGLWWFRHRAAERLPWEFLGLWLLAFYGTWLMTPRSKFLYYFTTASAGLDVALAAGVLAAWQALVVVRRRRWAKAALLSGGSVGFASVLYLLPLWVGMVMPAGFYHALWWPPSWNPRVRTASTSGTARSFSLTYRPSRQSVPLWSGLAVPASAPAVPNPWLMFRGALSHNSVFHASWTLKRGYALALGGKLVEAPTVSGTTAYVGTSNNALYAINVLNGSVDWSVGAPNEVMTAPLVDDGLVIVGLGNNGFRSYQRGQGWVRGQGANGLMAFDQNTGQEVWYHRTTGEDMATPVIVGHDLYEMTGDGRLIALDVVTGHRLWQKRLGGFDSMSSLMADGNMLYFSTNRYVTSYPAASSTVWAINAETRQVVWSTRIPVASGLSDCTVAIDNNRVVVAGVPAIGNHGQSDQLSNAVFGLNRTSGRIVWSHQLGMGRIHGLDQEEQGIPLAIDGVVYLGSPALRQMRAYAASDGHPLWATHLPMPVTANPVLVGHDLLVAGMNGTLWMLNPATGQVVGRDPANFGKIGPASPLVVSNALLQSTLDGDLVVQRLAPASS